MQACYGKIKVGDKKQTGGYRMRKVILKKAICVLLVLCLMFASSFSVYYFTERSALYADLNYMYPYPMYDFKDIWNEFNIFRYYARLPSGFEPEEINSSSIERYLDFARYYMELSSFGYQPPRFPSAVVRAKYLGKSSNPEYELRGEFRFKITEVVVGDKTGTVEVGDRVQYFSKRYNFCRYSTEEYMFSYYDVGYEIGEEYLLFLLKPPGDTVNYKNDEVPYYYIQAGGICLNKLSGK